MAGRKRSTVLLVDDEPMIRRAGKRLIESLGYSVLLAENGYEALATYTAHQQEIGVVLLDLCMPGIDGEETYQKLRSIDAEARVLVLSGFGHDDTADRLLSQGALGYVQKPFSLEDLSNRVRRALG